MDFGHDTFRIVVAWVAGSAFGRLEGFPFFSSEEPVLERSRAGGG